MGGISSCFIAEVQKILSECKTLHAHCNGHEIIEVKTSLGVFKTSMLRAGRRGCACQVSEKCQLKEYESSELHRRGRNGKISELFNALSEGNLCQA